MRRVPQQHTNPDVRRERDPRAMRRQAFLLSACVMLALGFVFAASQKIAAVQYGYRSEELRREREQVLEEQRRLLLTIEQNAAPESLERAARGLGMQPARASQIGAGDERASEATDSASEEEETTKQKRGATNATTPSSRGERKAAVRRSP
jgi:hypothetical protein